MPAASRDQQVPRSEEVFISYSRKDKEFVHRLDEELKRRDREAWVDWEGIPPGDTWEKTIYGAIESTHTFIFVLTPDSIASEVCGKEIAHAAANNKALRHEEWVISASFSANTRMFLTIVGRRENGVNCTPRIWDVATGRPLSDRFMRADSEHGSGISADAAEFIEGGLRFRLTQEQEVQEEEKAQAQIWDVALPQDDDIPVWLPRLAKLIGGYELNKQSGIIEPVRHRSEGLRQLRDELAKAPADDHYVKFGTWVLCDPTTRSISPYSKSSIFPKQ